MKALFIPRFAIKKNITFFILLTLFLWIYPEISMGASLQNAGQDKPLVFEVKNPTSLTENQTPSLSYNTLVQSDPLVAQLKQYLEQNNSPLAVYADQIVQQPQWERALAISNVESNLGQHCYDNNCSGIGGAPGYPTWRKYPTKLDWFKDLSQLLETPIYKDKYVTFRQMKGIYVSPGSEAWVYGAQHTYDQLKTLEQQANQQRLAQANTTQNDIVVASLSGTPVMTQLDK